MEMNIEKSDSFGFAKILSKFSLSKLLDNIPSRMNDILRCEQLLDKQTNNTYTF